MTRRIPNLLRDTRGASLIEFALAAPFLGALVVGMVDVSQGYSAKVKLTQAAQRAIEKAMQGEKTTDLYDTLQQEGATAAGVPTGQVTVKYWLECDGVNQNTSPSTMDSDYNDKVCNTGQISARYVNIDIQKTYTPFFAARFLGSNSDGTFTLHGKAGVRVQ